METTMLERIIAEGKFEAVGSDEMNKPLRDLTAELRQDGDSSTFYIQVGRWGQDLCRFELEVLSVTDINESMRITCCGSIRSIMGGNDTSIQITLPTATTEEYITALRDNRMLDSLFVAVADNYRLSLKDAMTMNAAKIVRAWQASDIFGEDPNVLLSVADKALERTPEYFMGSKGGVQLAPDDWDVDEDTLVIDTNTYREIPEMSYLHAPLVFQVESDTNDETEGDKLLFRVYTAAHNLESVVIDECEIEEAVWSLEKSKISR